MGDFLPRWRYQPMVDLHFIPSEWDYDIEWAGRKSTRTMCGASGHPSKFVKARTIDKHFSLGRFAQVMFTLKCSLICQKQLLRHKFADWCIESGRYCKQEPIFFIPKAFEDNPCDHEFYKRQCISSYKLYLEAIEGGFKKEDARYLLPGATMTELAMVMNFQATRDFIKLRTHKKAQLEIRYIARQIGMTMLEHAEEFFFDMRDMIEKAIEE